MRRHLIWPVVLVLLAGACTSGGGSPPGTSGWAPGASGTETSALGTVSPGTLPPVRATAGEVTEVSGAYRQGVARLDGGWLFSTNWALYRTDEALVETAKNEAAIPPEWQAKGYNHIGDVDVVGDVVYAPVEQPDMDRGRQAMLRYDARSLAYLDGVEVAQHHNSFVTVDPATLTAYSMDYFGGQAFVRYDVRDAWRPLPPLPLSTFVDKVQGADLDGGALWLASDDERKGLYRADATTGAVQAIGSVGWLDGETEGIDATPLPSGELHVLSIDAKLLPVRFARFHVAA